jgi:hypothetical protein
MGVWWWAEEAGRARRSERARVMRWERGLGGRGERAEGRGEVIRGQTRGRDWDSATSGSTCTGSRMLGLNGRRRCTRATDAEAVWVEGWGGGSWGKAAPVSVLPTEAGRERERRRHRTPPPVPPPQSSCGGRCGRAQAGADERASVSDGGRGGDWRGREGRRQDRAGARDTPARAGAGRISTRTDDMVLERPPRVVAEEGGAGGERMTGREEEERTGGKDRASQHPRARARGARREDGEAWARWAGRRRKGGRKREGRER